jgi:hypothetical protein
MEGEKKRGIASGITTDRDSMLALDTIEVIDGDENNAAIITYLTGFRNSRVLDITRVGHFDYCAFHHAFPLPS